MWVSDIDSRINIANYHNDVRTDTIRPRSLHNFIDVKLVGCGDSTHRCRDSGTEFSQSLFYIPPDFEVYISANNGKIVSPHKIKIPTHGKTAG